MFFLDYCLFGLLACLEGRKRFVSHVSAMGGSLKKKKFDSFVEIVCLFICTKLMECAFMARPIEIF